MKRKVGVKFFRAKFPFRCLVKRSESKVEKYVEREGEIFKG